MILDTSFLIDLFAGHRSAYGKGRTLSDDQIVQRVPAPVVMELSYGAGFGDEAERRNVQNALRMYPVVELDDRTAQRAGALFSQADLDAGGESGVETVDAMVAAAADRQGEPVLTANLEEFRSLGVDVEPY